MWSVGHHLQHDITRSWLLMAVVTFGRATFRSELSHNMSLFVPQCILCTRTCIYLHVCIACRVQAMAADLSCRHDEGGGGGVFVKGASMDKSLDSQVCAWVDLHIIFEFFIMDLMYSHQLMTFIFTPPPPPPCICYWS